MRVRAIGFAPVVVVLSCVPLAAAAQQVEGTPSSLYKDSWAVLIGINDYRHPDIPKLPYAVNDVRAIERTLLAQAFRPDRITRLTDAAADWVGSQLPEAAASPRPPRHARRTVHS